MRAPVAIFAFAVALLVAMAGCSPAGGPSTGSVGEPPAPGGAGTTAQTPAPPDDGRDGPLANAPSHAVLMQIPDAVPRWEPLSWYGNPPTYKVLGRTYHTLRSREGYVERGIASWYGRKFHKRLTSNREPYDMLAMTAAHRSLPLPTYARVTHLENGRSIVVRINDRGPFSRGRIIDLSYTAAVKLGIVGPGTGPVEVRAIEPERAPPGEGAVASLPPSPAPGRVQLYVQLGAYGDEANARRALGFARQVRPELAAMTRIEPAGGGRTALQRVRIGPLPGVEEADRVLAELEALGVREARMIVERKSEGKTEESKVARGEDGDA